MADTERTMTIYEKADNLMYNHGLLGLLQKYGDVSIVGSYRMGIMTWNDIDFYMDKANLNELLQLNIRYYKRDDAKPFQRRNESKERIGFFRF